MARAGCSGSTTEYNEITASPRLDGGSRPTASSRPVATGADFTARGFSGSGELTAPVVVRRLRPEPAGARLRRLRRAGREGEDRPLLQAATRRGRPTRPAGTRDSQTPRAEVAGRAGARRAWRCCGSRRRRRARRRARPSAACCTGRARSRSTSRSSRSARPSPTGCSAAAGEAARLRALIDRRRSRIRGRCRRGADGRGAGRATRPRTRPATSWASCAAATRRWRTGAGDRRAPRPRGAAGPGFYFPGANDNASGSAGGAAPGRGLHARPGSGRRARSCSCCSPARNRGWRARSFHAAAPAAAAGRHRRDVQPRLRGLRRQHPGGFGQDVAGTVGARPRPRRRQRRLHGHPHLGRRRRRRDAVPRGRRQDAVLGHDQQLPAPARARRYAGDAERAAVREAGAAVLPHGVGRGDGRRVMKPAVKAGGAGAARCGVRRRGGGRDRAGTDHTAGVGTVLQREQRNRHDRRGRRTRRRALGLERGTRRGPVLPGLDLQGAARAVRAGRGRACATSSRCSPGTATKHDDRRLERRPDAALVDAALDRVGVPGVRARDRRRARTRVPREARLRQPRGGRRRRRRSGWTARCASRPSSRWPSCAGCTATNCRSPSSTSAWSRTS